MHSYVQNKKSQRWLWLSLDHNTNKIIAFVFGKRREEVFLKLKKLLKPFKISIFYTDKLNIYKNNLDSNNHVSSKRYIQRIERKNLTLRTIIKRLHRKTICFSKSIEMRDTVSSLVINLLDFNLITPYQSF